ncbi:MAG TPA: sodium:solute symporter family protein [Candidatus Acidoferrales bacterium]|nr:sodium:solute symporter family protein [Candidatus Acidoferrales bacterium]
MNLYLIFLFAYAVLLIVVGLLVSRRVKKAADFFVAGRTLGPGLLATTFLAANIGAGSTVGASGLGYRFGLSAWWWVGSAAIGSFILAATVGPKIWVIAEKYQFDTVGDYLDRRYSRAVRATVAVLLWLGTLAILAAQLIAIAWILDVVAGLPKWQGCLLGGLVVVTYFAAGGLLTAVWVNLIELIVLLTGLLVAIPFALDNLGGWPAAVQQVSSRFASAAEADRFFSFTGIGLKGILAYVVILVPSFIVSPGLIQKVYGARDQRAVRLGVGLNALALFFFAVVPPLFGVFAFARYPGLANPELALPTVLKEMLPLWLGVLVLAAIFSAEISSCDAILFMLSTSLSVDLYKTFLNPRVTEKRLLAVSRATAVVAGLLGVAVAILLPSIISALTIFYGLLAVALFVPLLLGLYWRSISARAALVSILGAVPATFVVDRWTAGQGWGPLSPHALGILVGLALALVATFLFHSRIQSPGERETGAADE